MKFKIFRSLSLLRSSLLAGKSVTVTVYNPSVDRCSVPIHPGILKILWLETCLLVSKPDRSFGKCALQFGGWGGCAIGFNFCPNQ